MEETRLEQYEDAIAENLRGWVTLEDLENVVPTLNIHDIGELKSFVNDRDRINLRSTGSTATKSTYFVDHKTDKPYKKWKQQIPSETHSIFDDWVGRGKAPRVIVALIKYLSNKENRVMSSVADENNCCPASIQNNKEEMIQDLRDKGIKIYN